MSVGSLSVQLGVALGVLAVLGVAWLVFSLARAIYQRARRDRRPPR